MKKSKKQNQAESKHLRSSYLFYGLLLLLFFPPFFRGLFFDKELLVFHIITAILFMAFICFELEHPNFNYLKNPMDYAAIGLLLIYIISSFTAFIPRDALKEVLKLINYILVYYMVSYYSRQEKAADKILNAFYFSGVGVAIVGILAASNVIYVPGAIIYNRLSSTIGYPNTLAAYLTVVVIIGLFQAVRNQKNYWQSVYSTSNYILFFAFLWTQSRGALVILATLLIIMFIGPARDFRKNLMFQTGMTALPAVLVYPMIINSNSNIKLIWFLAGFLIVGTANIITKVLGRFKCLLENKKLPVLIITVVFLLAITIGLGLAKDNMAVAFQRITKISFQERNFQERLAFDRDAFQIIKDYPIIGTGGGGWAAIYRKYQGHGYLSRAVHNHFLQTWVELGTVGFICLSTLWLSFVYVVIKKLKTKSNMGSVNLWIAFLVNITLGLHSLIDFNLMFGSLALLNWSMFGVARSATGDNEEFIGKQAQPGKYAKMCRYMLAAGTVSFALLSANLLIGLVYGEKGQRLFEVDKMAAQEYLEKARILDPLNANYPGLLSVVWKDKGTKAQKDDLYKPNDKLAKALDYANISVKLDRGNPDRYINRGKILVRMGMFDKARKDYEMALNLFPNNRELYEDLAELYFKLGTIYKKSGNISKAQYYFKSVTSVPDMVKVQIKKISPARKKLWVSRVPELAVTSKLNDLYKKAKAETAQVN